MVAAAAGAIVDAVGMEMVADGVRVLNLTI
jgi:hypothetical protein